MMSKEVVMRWLAALMLSVLVGGGAVGRPGAEPSVVVQMEGDRLSVSAEEAPLKDIVAEIGRATSIKISGEARLDPQVANQAQTVGFHELKVERRSGGCCPTTTSSWCTRPTASRSISM